MSIFWKNYLYIAISLSIISVIFLFIIPLEPHDMALFTVLSGNKLRILMYMTAILGASALISYISVKNMNRVISKTGAGIMGLFQSNHYLNEFSHTNYNEYSIEDKLAQLKTFVDEAQKTLSTSIRNLQSENDQLLILMNAINEGIAVISQKGLILMSNHQFEQIFEISVNPKGRPYWEVLRINEISEIIESALQKKQSVFKEISIIHPLEKYYFINIISHARLIMR